MKKTIGVLIVVIVIIIILASTGGKKGETGPIKIGFIGPMTGDVTALGQASRAAVEVAAEEINAAGGINGRNIEMVYEDGRCSPVPATNAVQKLINSDKVSAVVGGLCSSETAAFVKIAMDAKVPVVAYCSSAPNLTGSGKYFFRDYPSDAYQGKYAAEYAYNVLGARKVAIIYHITDWGNGLKTVFGNRFKELGGTIVAEEGSAQDNREYKTQLAKIKATNPDYLYTPLYPEGGYVMVQQALQLGIKTKMLGGDGWADTKFIVDVSKLNPDILYTEIVTGGGNNPDFSRKVLAKTGGTQVPICAPQAYDALTIIADAIKKTGSVDADKLADAIRSTKHDGISGTIEFDQNGDMTSANYAVKRIANGVSTEVK
jgi:branched-chain amino acid transport system substrate-binding protein